MDRAALKKFLTYNPRTGVERTVVGTVLVCLVLFAVFIIYSIAIKDWCEMHEGTWGGKAWGERPFAEKLGQCIKDKSFFSF